MSDDLKLGVMVYDGINFFKNGEWTGIEFNTIEEAEHMLSFLKELDEEQIDHWVRVQKYIRDEKRQQTYNTLRQKTKYSGKTSAHNPINWSVKDKWKETPFMGPDCVEVWNVISAQWSNLPVEVEEEIAQIWRDDDRLCNDTYYFKWDNDEELREKYPIVAEYLDIRGIKKCLINWWW